MNNPADKGIGKLWRLIWQALASTRLAVGLLAALGLLTLAGTLLPQLPIAVEESARATWLALAQQKYGSLYAPLRFLGLFELYHSPGFAALLVALFVNTALCTINRLRALGRMMRKQRLVALGSLITHVAVITLLTSLAILRSEPGRLLALLSALALVLGIAPSLFSTTRPDQTLNTQPTPRNTQYALPTAPYLSLVTRHSSLIPWLSTTFSLTLIIALALRGMAARRWPLGTPFEFTLAFAASVVLAYSLLSGAAQTSLPGIVAIIFTVLLVLHALFLQPETARAIQSLPSVMRGLWFALHTLFTALAYGALTLAGDMALCVMMLSTDENRTNGRVQTDGRPSNSIVRFSSVDRAFVDRAMSVGYIALSLGMIAGGIWSAQAWGEPWTWSVKEAWTLIIWLICTFYYHVRQRRGWRGRGAMYVVVLAMVSVLATFFFTPTLLHWERLQRWRIY
jgi:ABC-type transport system involved in cytochrome c biogenesis permease subunit